MQTAERIWWTRPGLEVRDGRLAIAGRDAEQLARGAGLIFGSQSVGAQ